MYHYPASEAGLDDIALVIEQMMFDMPKPQSKAAPSLCPEVKDLSTKVAIEHKALPPIMPAVRNRDENPMARARMPLHRPSARAPQLPAAPLIPAVPAFDVDCFVFS